MKIGPQHRFMLFRIASLWVAGIGHTGAAIASLYSITDHRRLFLYDSAWNLENDAESHFTVAEK